LVDFEFVAKINSILGASLVHNAGCIRDIPVGISGTAWQPEMPDFDTAKATIEKIANMEPGRERALKMFGYLCRSQFFSDGNKRTAQLVANKMLIADGRGILAIPPECKHDFGEKLKRFYETADDSELQKFLIETSIYN
ncbi:cell filamentation protein Fic, partial [Coprococcus comes]|uniref:Fic family protein n=1 Tax=Coprococcus comes TaxID=410072 RepID=UPI001C033358